MWYIVISIIIWIICFADPADFYALDAQLESEASEDILPVTVNTHNILFIGLAIVTLILAVSVAIQFTNFIDETKWYIFLDGKLECLSVKCSW
jgi:hypothetical protein